MGVLHSFCRGNKFPQHDPAQMHFPHPSRYPDGGVHPHPHSHHDHHTHENHHFHDNHHSQEHRHGSHHHHHHHHQHYHNMRMGVPSPKQDRPNSRGNVTRGGEWTTGLWNTADHDHHGNVGGMYHGHRSPLPRVNTFQTNHGEGWNTAAPENGVQQGNVQMHRGSTDQVPNTFQQSHGSNVGQMGTSHSAAKGKSCKENNVTWGGAYGGTPTPTPTPTPAPSQWHSGPSKPKTPEGSWNGPNGTNVVQMEHGTDGWTSMTTNYEPVEQKAKHDDTKACRGQSSGVRAAPDGEVSYNITIHKHIKGGRSVGYTKVNKNSIHFHL